MTTLLASLTQGYEFPLARAVALTFRSFAGTGSHRTLKVLNFAEFARE